MADNNKVVDGVERVASAAFEAIGASLVPTGLIGAVFKDHQGRAPVIPADMNSSRLPPVAADGTVTCWTCQSRVAFANVNIVNEAYVCGPCSVLRAQRSAELAPDPTTVSLRSHRWVWKVLLVLAILGTTLGVILYSRARSEAAERARQSSWRPFGT